ncbi:hypothetical protein CK203_099147 [Vitis vinifera]|uniref:Uncharacterized protein n=1 Tax=Vitis vinifera TaxID=29760 RepID=A0A438CWR8_VITVI|nr:hypothetical protein CK203_099147 [Vitis vinifera]
MVVNLRAAFKERQCKRLSKSITVIPPPSKRPYPEILCPWPILAIAPILTPSAVVVGDNPSTEEVAHPELRRPSSCLVQLNDDSVECVASIPPHPQASRTPSREEITELMKTTPTFPSRPNFPSALRTLSSPLACPFVTDVQNLMRQRALLFKWLEVVKAMRAYIAHNMNDNEELHAKLKAVEGELAAVGKIIDEGVGLLKKAEEGKGAVKAEARRLVEKEVIEARHKKVEQENE